MKNAAETSYQPAEDEEGVADGAASLGADGGPASKGVSQDSDAFEGDIEISDDDDAWLNEELSDEELAALGEEDFGDDLFEDDIFDEEVDAENSAADGDEFSAADLAEIEAAFDEGRSLEDSGASELDPAEDAAIEDAFDSEDTFDSDTNVETQSGVAESQGALVTAAVTGAGALEQQDYGGAVSDVPEEEMDHRPVPRISIHAFCETPETTALLEKASVDRRLSKAHLTIHMGGVAKAVDHFQTASTPNLIILETLVGGAEIFSKLGELAEVCDPSTKVVIIGKVNDIILYRELIKQGVSEYIVRPNSPLQIIKAVADLYVDPSAPPIGKTMAFVGARGGAGSSSIAHNVGWCSAEEFKSDTIILDLDLPFGTASLDFDQEASAGLVEALSSPERLDDVLLDRLLQKHTDRLSLFTAPSMLDRDFDMDDQAYETVLDVVRGTAPTIIVDIPHMWTSWSKRILMTADEIVITATPDLASFRNTKNLMDILGAARPNDASPTLVINQFDPKTSAVQPDQFAEHVGIKPAQVINWDPQLFGAAATNASPITEVGSKSKAAQSIRDLSAHLLGRAETNIARPKFSLSGLFKKKR
ncbi:cellulose synthase operon protein YhjQ/BcsQ [Hyphococcus flavus]|uniref:Cellulose synthase operon protein YhjQ/BcsQ n=1 Tax=Hyphococcus flavus TaxID=1866326 RepID=A0AAE9ZHY2_9PROT|nr:cellulose synthase operon protein YhjQ/BcsQ [Hyphococcus flavus]WDI33197.1 cellulose synthase operon protein YhjQ/BcsQ [Hyphococcus flavus]